MAGPETSWADGVRWRALREAAAELELRGAPDRPERDPPCCAGLSARAGSPRIDATAVLAYNDPLAIGIMKGLRKLGMRVPGEVSVVGLRQHRCFDELVDPALTTVAVAAVPDGVHRRAELHRAGQGARPSGGPLVLPVRLVVRQSTPRRQRRRNSTSPARGTTSVSGSAAKAATSIVAGSR